jgi:hypothetical protein
MEDILYSVMGGILYTAILWGWIYSCVLEWNVLDIFETLLFQQ